jgi:hypothetical protein
MVGLERRVIPKAEDGDRDRASRWSWQDAKQVA